MSVVSINKISGVVTIKDDINTNGKSYFGANGNYQASDNNLTVNLQIGSAGQVQKDSYVLTLGSVAIGSGTPLTMSSLLVNLNAIFGT